MTQTFVDSCVDFEVAHLSVCMVQRLPWRGRGGGGAEIHPTVILYEISFTAVIDLLHYVHACMYNLMCLWIHNS